MTCALNKYYKTLFIGIAWMIFIQTASAQLFQKAPNYQKKIHKIIEWNRGVLTDESIKGATSVFDIYGRLKSYANLESTIRYEYNAKGKLVKIKENGNARRLTQISYKPNVSIRELSFRGKTYKTELYYKASKLVERKVLAKGAELGNKYLLKERSVYRYNQFDSLAQELHYIYSIPHNTRSEKRKTIYKYDKTKKKLLSKTFYDTDGTIRKKSSYHYNGDQVVEQIDHYPSENRKSSTKYLYKSGNLWQKIFQNEHSKNVWIYADNRLIRLRSYYGNKPFQVIDYQYLYFE